jgi:glutathione-regulated potassium-efflux system ancillary protein KefG
MERGRVLILFAHPAFDRSRVQRRLVEAVRDLPGVTLHDLYEVYPDFGIDVGREQRLLSAHDVIVFQHPLYWYSTPSLLKEWQDLVLEHGWAYGTGATALRGKRFLSVVTTGGREASYGRNGLNRFTIREFLVPIEQTAFLCGMDYVPPFVVYGTHAMTEDDAKRRGEDYRRLIEALRDGSLKPPS